MSRGDAGIGIVAGVNGWALAPASIAGNKEVVVSENVMPGIGVLQVEQVRSIIRDLFIKRIIDAKGLKNAERFIDSILMPTPTAVLNAARLLAEGTPNEPGLGELVIVDIGGATTDVHSISIGTWKPDIPVSQTCERTVKEPRHAL
jgi:uncharacterized protein (TIGR01319 family)